ncbi:hypothetical protein [Phytoactinopolyspora alkaliphila]|uniref:hypothetical protein n=1 Tax=Phytoactinopolyspora alkaliphila TaxID=1783498 RepID=UPI0015769636|nr:hypothetical protein [Phytoactinopolyspora alkaliphila]
MKHVVVAVFAIFALLTGLATTAHAGGDSTLAPGHTTTLAGPCGSSYSHIGHHPITASSTTVGHLDVYWSSSTKRNCLVTNHSGPTYGVRLFTEARIRPSGYSWPSCPSSTGCDSGFYSYYAGPVYTPAGVDMTNRCIDVTGTVDWTSRTRTRIHCG